MFFFGFWSKTFSSASMIFSSMAWRTVEMWVHLDAGGQSWELHCWDLWLPFSLAELGQPLWVASRNQTDIERSIERSKKAQWWPWPLWRLFTWPRLVAIIPRAAQARNLWFDVNGGPLIFTARNNFTWRWRISWMLPLRRKPMKMEMED